MEIVIPIGISGSGKSRLYNLNYQEYVKICPDDIRKELTRSISDQSKNKEVFELAQKRIDDCIANDKNVFYDATNINTEYRKKFVNKYKGTNVRIVYVILPADVNISYQRIKNDLDNKVDRSKVPYQVLLRQYEMYKDSLNSQFKDENVDEIIYL